MRVISVKRQVVRVKLTKIWYMLHGLSARLADPYIASDTLSAADRGATLARLTCRRLHKWAMC